jgi:hypothetical protein
MNEAKALRTELATRFPDIWWGIADDCTVISGQDKAYSNPTHFVVKVTQLPPPLPCVNADGTPEEGDQAPRMHYSVRAYVGHVVSCDTYTGYATGSTVVEAFYKLQKYCKTMAAKCATLDKYIDTHSVTSNKPTE